MAQKFAFVNNKGGSAKTTTVVNLAGALHVRYPDKKILIFEVDGQGNATRSFNLNPKDYKISAENIYLGLNSADEAIIKNVADNIDLIPGNDDLNFLEFDKMQEAEETLPNSTVQVTDVLKDQLKKKIQNTANLRKSDILNLIDTAFSANNVQTLIKRAQSFPSKNYFNMLSGKIDKINEEYDYIFFDTPPELKAVTSSVLAVCDKVIIPYEPDSYSVDGIKNIIERIHTVKKEYNPKLEIGGLLASKFKNTNVHRDTVLLITDFANTVGLPFFSTRIPATVAFPNSITSYGKPATLAKKIGKQRQKFVNYYFMLLDEMIDKKILTV